MQSDSLEESRPSETKLERSISFRQLVFYGLGTMVGGGFYALLGKVAGEAGMHAPVALTLTGLLAILICLSFAEFASRFPVSAGESRYVEEGFRARAVGAAVGWLVILTGVVSAAALTVATVGFLDAMVEVPEPSATILVGATLGAIAAWGIGASVRVVMGITIIEVGALVYAMWVADGSVLGAAARWREFVPPLNPQALSGVFSGAFLAFYAFIGFEDMVNVAEEVRDPRRTLPRALIVSVALTVALYVAVSMVAVTSVPPAELARSSTPIAAMVGETGRVSQLGLGIVSLLTGVNGALVQLIMAARVAYGLAQRGQAPAWLGAVHPVRRTPIRATILCTLCVLLLALGFPLAALARITSTIIIVVFGLVCLALWNVKRRAPDLDGEGPRYPRWVPLAGALSCLVVLAARVWGLLAI